MKDFDTDLKARATLEIASEMVEARFNVSVPWRVAADMTELRREYAYARMLACRMLRRLGLSYPAIRDRLGYRSQSGVHKSCNRADFPFSDSEVELAARSIAGRHAELIGEMLAEAAK